MITLDNLGGSFSHPYRNFSISSENLKVLSVATKWDTSKDRNLV